MLKIYGAKRSRATRNVWLCYEAGIPFEQVPIFQPYRSARPGMITTRMPEFLKINPNGHVPAIDDDGFVMFESLAINLYLAKKHGGPTAPKDIREEALAAMWSLWAANEVEVAALDIMMNRVMKPEAERDEKIVQKSIESLRTPFAVLDKALAESGYAMGGRFTVADINLAEVVRYAAPAAELFAANPRVKTWLETCQARPAFKRMWAEREEEAI